ncbi:MAG TPA: MBL fold metallo-hydrolase [Candidatus Aminicenantes bacterium]|nr:MBL fold metallo-hydrolase [Candidatus Aminicenantes bacterium]
MTVTPLLPDKETYGCSSYLVMGEWKRLEDINTLIDAGGNDRIVAQIEAIPTGVGKKGVERVILTHSHFDHMGGLAAIIDRYHPEVLAFSMVRGVTRVLRNGERLRCGSGTLEVIHVPGHSQDSICLLDSQQGILFTGDMPLRVYTAGGSYTRPYAEAIERFAGLALKTICPGHGLPIEENIDVILRKSLANLRKCTLVDG